VLDRISRRQGALLIKCTGKGPQYLHKKFGIRAKFLAQQTSGSLATVFVDGVSCRPYVVPPGWVGTLERTYLSNNYFQRDLMFSQLELTGKYARVLETYFQPSSDAELQMTTQCSMIEPQMT
jgi:hypothetical protein